MLQDFEGVKPRRSISYNGGSIKFKNNSAESAILRALLSSSWDAGDIREEGEKENIPSPTAMHPKIRWNTLCDKICKEVQKEQALGRGGTTVVRDQDDPFFPGCQGSNEQTEPQVRSCAVTTVIKTSSAHALFFKHSVINRGTTVTAVCSCFLGKVPMSRSHEISCTCLLFRCASRVMSFFECQLRFGISFLQPAVITSKDSNPHERNCCPDNQHDISTGARTTEGDAPSKAKKVFKEIHESSVESTLAGVNSEDRETSVSETLGERERNVAPAEIFDGAKLEGVAGESQQRKTGSSEDISTVSQSTRTDGQDNHGDSKLSIGVFPADESNTEPGLCKTNEPPLEPEKSNTSQSVKVQDVKGKDAAEATGSCETKAPQHKKGMRKANPVPPPPPRLRRARKTGGADIVREPQVSYLALCRNCV